MIFIWAKCLPESVYFKIFRDANSWGRCVRKWRFSKRETAFAGSTFFDDNDDDDDDDILLML